MKRNEGIRIAAGAMLAALYVVFSNVVVLNFGLIKFSFESIPVLLAGFLFGRREGLLVGIVGPFIAQALGSYGLSITTPLWILPYAAAGWLAGLRLREDFLKNGKARTVLLTLICQITITVLTLAATYADAAIMGYPHGMTAVLIGMRFVNAILRTAVCCLIISAPLDILKRTVPGFENQR